MLLCCHRPSYKGRQQTSVPRHCSTLRSVVGGARETHLLVRSCRLRAEWRALLPSAPPPCSSNTPSKILSARLSKVPERPEKVNRACIAPFFCQRLCICRRGRPRQIFGAVANHAGLLDGPNLLKISVRPAAGLCTPSQATCTCIMIYLSQSMLIIGKSSP